jgi:hypothetical protein
VYSLCSSAFVHGYVNDTVIAAAGGLQAGELSAERFADAPGILGAWADIRDVLREPSQMAIGY